MTVPSSGVDSNPQAGGSQPDPATPPNPQAGGAASDNAGQHPQAGEGQISADRFREVQREAQALRKRLAEIDEATRQAELAKLGDLERAKAEAAKHQQAALEYQQKYQELAVRSAIKDKAVGMGFHDPDDACRFLLASGDLDYDEDGQPKNAEKLLKALSENKPYLLKTAAPQQPQAGVFPANPSRSGQTAKPDWRNPAAIRNALMDSNNWKK